MVLGALDAGRIVAGTSFEILGFGGRIGTGLYRDTAAEALGPEFATGV